MSGVLNKVAYHFTGPRLRDGTPIPPIGHKLVFPHKPILCGQGLHFSLHPFDALQYAPGPLLHRVHYGGTVVMGDDKGVCTERTIVASIDATHMLRKFACDEALRVLPKDAPDIVRRYLTTRDEGLRDAARDAARNAAYSAARNAALSAPWNAAWDAAYSAAYSAVRDAAWYAARDAARDAAWYAARDAARDAAYSAAYSAVRDGARDAARYAAWCAAWDVVKKRQRNTFLSIVEYGFGKASNNSIPV